MSVPRTLPEALELLASGPEAEPLAGGTDLMVAINFGRRTPRALVAVGGLCELSAIEVGERLRVGAAVPYSEITSRLAGTCPVVAEAAATVGSPQIRNVGTLGGNLGTCSPAGDPLTALAALEAEIIVASAAGTRRVPMAEFMLGPKRPDLRAGELVLAVEWRAFQGASAFLKVGTRNAMVIAVANAALVLDREHRRVGLALGSVAPTVVRAPDAETFAAGLLDAAGWEPTALAPADLREFGRRAAAAARPIDDIRGSAAYRRHVVAVLAARALDRCSRSA